MASTTCQLTREGDRRRWLVVALVVAVFTACSSEPSPGDNPQAFFAGKWQGYVSDLVKGDAGAVANHFTEDAILMQSDMADVSGRAKIRELVSEGFASARVSAVEVLPKEVIVKDEVAHEWGTLSETVVPTGQSPATYKGRYAAVWKRQADGTWKIARLLLNNLPSADAE